MMTNVIIILFEELAGATPTPRPGAVLAFNAAWLLIPPIYDLAHHATRASVRRMSDFAAKYGPWAVVAGASSGLGEEFARQLAAAGST